MQLVGGDSGTGSGEGDGRGGGKGIQEDEFDRKDKVVKDREAHENDVSSNLSDQ